MNNLTIIIVITLLFSFAYAQNTTIESLIQEGIALYDAGKYNEASEKYIKALTIDSLNYTAKYELVMAYFSMAEYEKSITLCKNILNGCTNDITLKNCYTTYGSCLDNIDRYKDAVTVFSEGIDKYPDSYLLHFNLGVTHLKRKKYDEAETCFKNDLYLKPSHSSSHLFLGNVMEIKNERIPAIMAYSRFLLLEPKGERAKKAFSALLGTMNSNVEKGEGNNITIFMNPQTNNDSSTTDNFYIVDGILTLAAALDYDNKNKDKTEVDLFINKYKSLCAGLEEQKLNNKGFFWFYYAPYFIKMKKNNYIETVAYMLFYYNRDEKYIDDWVKNNSDKIKEVQEWSINYKWNQ